MEGGPVLRTRAKRNIAEEAPKKTRSRVKKSEDQDLDSEDSKSVSTEHSIKNCSVILTDVCRTRARASSTLTVDNLAVHDSSPRRTRRSVRANSVLSEDVANPSPVKRVKGKRASSVLSEDVAHSPVRRGRSTRASSVLSEEHFLDSPIKNGKTPKKEITTPNKRRQSMRSKALIENIGEAIKEVEEPNIDDEIKSADNNNVKDKNDSSKKIEGEQFNEKNNSIESEGVSVIVKTPTKKYNIRDDVTPKKVSSPLKKTSELINVSISNKTVTPKVDRAENNEKSPSKLPKINIESIEIIESNVSALTNSTLDQNKTTESNVVEETINISDEEEQTTELSDNNKKTESNLLEIDETPASRKSITPRKLLLKTPTKSSSPLQKTSKLINESISNKTATPKVDKAENNEKTPAKPVKINIESIEISEPNVSALKNNTLDQNKTTESNIVEGTINISDKEERIAELHVSSSSDNNKQTESNFLEIDETPASRKSVTPRKLLLNASNSSPKISSPVVKAVEDSPVKKKSTPTIVKKEEESFNIVNGDLHKSSNEKSNEILLKFDKQENVQNVSNENKPAAKEVQLEGVETPKAKSNGTYVRTPFPRKNPMTVEDEEEQKSVLEKLSKSWNQSIRGGKDKAIDALGIMNRTTDDDVQKIAKVREDSSFERSNTKESDEEEISGIEDSENEEEENDKNEFIDDEAMEVDENEEESEDEHAENQLPSYGVDIGSDDTDDAEDECDDDDDVSSFIVSDREEEGLSSDDEVEKSITKQLKKYKRIRMESESMEEVDIIYSMNNSHIENASKIYSPRLLNILNESRESKKGKSPLINRVTSADFFEEELSQSSEIENTDVPKENHVDLNQTNKKFENSIKNDEQTDEIDSNDAVKENQESDNESDSELDNDNVVVENDANENSENKNNVEEMDVDDQVVTPNEDDTESEHENEQEQNDAGVEKEITSNETDTVNISISKINKKLKNKSLNESIMSLHYTTLLEKTTSKKSPKTNKPKEIDETMMSLHASILEQTIEKSKPRKEKQVQDESMISLHYQSLLEKSIKKPSKELQSIKDFQNGFISSTPNTKNLKFGANSKSITDIGTISIKNGESSHSFDHGLDQIKKKPENGNNEVEEVVGNEQVNNKEDKKLNGNKENAKNTVNKAKKNKKIMIKKTVCENNNEQLISKPSTSKSNFVENVNKEKLKKPRNVAGPSNRLKIITRSGEFNVSDLPPQPITRFGFRESPITPMPRTFKIQNENEYKPKIKKRRIDFEEPTNVLPKPCWSVVPNIQQTTKRRRIQETLNGSGDICIVKLKPTPKIIPNEILNYRKNNIYRKGVQRHSSHVLNQQKHKFLYK